MQYHINKYFDIYQRYWRNIRLFVNFPHLNINLLIYCFLFGFYREEGFYVGLLECVVGRKKMSELYLNADLLGLIEELNKYSSIKSILSFIDRMDYILSVKRFALTNTLSDAVISEYSESFDVVNKFIIKIYLKKWKERYNHFEELNDEDNLDKLLDELELFLELIVDFNVVTDEDTQEQLLLLDPDKLEKDVAKAIGVKKIKIFEYV